MTRAPRRLIAAGIVLPVWLASCTGTLPPTAPDPAAIHDRAITIDTHVDIPTTLGRGDADPGLLGPMQYDLHKMRAGNIDAAFFIVYVRQGDLTAEGFRGAYLQALRGEGLTQQQVDSHLPEVRECDDASAILGRFARLSAVQVA